MDREARSKVISFLFILAVGAVIFFVIRNNIDKKREQARIAEAAEVGDLGKINVNINGSVYVASLESNKTAQEFLSKLPLSIEATDYNNLAKSGLLYFKLMGNSIRYTEVQAGDIMLSGESKIYIFYKSDNIKEKFTKIGHIDKIKELDNSSVTIGFVKPEK